MPEGGTQTELLVEAERLGDHPILDDAAVADAMYDRALDCDWTSSGRHALPVSPVRAPGDRKRRDVVPLRHGRLDLPSKIGERVKPCADVLLKREGSSLGGSRDSHSRLELVSHAVRRDDLAGDFQTALVPELLEESAGDRSGVHSSGDSLPFPLRTLRRLRWDRQGRLNATAGRFLVRHEVLRRAAVQPLAGRSEVEHRI